MSRRPRYLDALLKHLERNPPEPGSLVHVEIRHDDDCPFWDGHHCDCDVEVETGEHVDRRHGGER